MVALGEYFTEDEFREITRDEDSPQKFETADIERGHNEVVNRLEAWARSCWGPPRTYRLRRLVVKSYLDLSRIPVIDITSFTLGGQTVDPTAFEFDAMGGELAWGDWTNMPAPALVGGPAWVVVEWTYGHDLDVADVPWEIKRPCIKAARSLLLPDKRDTKIPPNARSYSTQRANFDLRFERAQTKPWPWDEGMSSQVRAFWDPFRWRAYMS